MTPPDYDLVIAGGGLAGSLAALALAERRPEVRLLLVEAQDRLGGNHVWSFFDTDVADRNRWLADAALTARWPSHDIRFPHRRRTLDIGYNSLRSDDLDRAVRARLGPDRLRLGTAIVQLDPHHVEFANRETVTAAAVIDARGPRTAPDLDLGWQKFVGQTLRFARPHGCERPMIMDATVDQHDGYRFVYLLPFSDTELMVEDTYYSASPALDAPTLRTRIGDYAAAAFDTGFQIVAEETGVLPVLLGGDVASLWTDEVPRLGVAGGFFHPTTGYSLPDAVRNAAWLAEQEELTAAALRKGLFERAAGQWRDRRFFQLLNRMLFRAGEPAERYRILEHFYRLPEAIVGRFYAAGLTRFDKLRILTGRPPVPVASALRALRSEAA